MVADAVDLSTFLEQTDFDLASFRRFADRAHESFAARERFEEMLREHAEIGGKTPVDALRQGVGLLILGRYGPALEAFDRAPDTASRHYFAAQAALALGRYAQAVEEFGAAAKAGWDRIETDLQIAAVHARVADGAVPRANAGDAEAQKRLRDALAAANKILSDRSAQGEGLAQWHYVRGLLAELEGDPAAAREAYASATRLDADHTAAGFRLARLYEQAGMEDSALDVYARLTAQPRAFANALLNASLLYEDRGDYAEAADCLRRVLQVEPNHRRARLFLKSVESCRQMVIREPGDERIDPRQRMLASPISEFELSVRARNCLKKMNIRTLGDLTRLREEELLAYKNFGETSLTEIKALLQRRGLKLGQGLEEAPAEPVEAAPIAAPPPRPVVPPGQEGVLGVSVAELELSVRSRRCLQRLNIKTLGDLVQYSEADLLATRNFGVTSLNEIRARLAERGLQLAVKEG